MAENEADPVRRKLNSLIRIRAAMVERNETLEKIQNLTEGAERRFWIKIASEITTGQISQADVVDVLGLNRETVRQRTRQYVPDAPARTGSPVYPCYLAVGMREVGADHWLVGSGAGLSTVSMPISGGGSNGPSPYNERFIEIAYREIDAPPADAAMHPPTWLPDLGRRPLFFSDEVVDEIFGPADTGSSKHQEWKARHGRS